MSEPAYSVQEVALLRLANRHFTGREVICPKCGAGVGVPCRGRSGFRSHVRARGHVGSHIERIELARRLEDTRICK